MSARTARLGICLFVCLLRAISASGQERDPNGRIYNELVPLVGLGGVRFDLTSPGGGNVIYNVLGLEPGEDPEKLTTGFTLAENRALWIAAREKAVSVLVESGVPLLGNPTEQGEDLRPQLNMAVYWQRREKDLFRVQVYTELLETARRIREPPMIIWARVWWDTTEWYAVRQELLASVLDVVRNHARSFADDYRRAHAH